MTDGHNLHAQPLRGLKQFIEKTSRRGVRLTVVLAGQPRLKNDLRRSAREEIGARTTVFELEGIQGYQRRYITWLLEQCASEVDPTAIVTPEALELLAERLMTPLQMQHYLTRVLEQAYRFGEKPGTPALVHATLAPDLHALEPTLTRYGYNVQALSELLNIRQAEVRAFLHGQLPPGRTEELHNQLLAAGIPLSDQVAETHLAMGQASHAAGCIDMRAGTSGTNRGALLVNGSLRAGCRSCSGRCEPRGYCCKATTAAHGDTVERCAWTFTWCLMGSLTSSAVGVR